MGAPGAQGPQGLKGDPGADGAMGAAGAMGAGGAQGPQGVQGLQGPAGTVLVLDGGVVTGPAGSSVLVSVIAAGGATCPSGGVRVTQLSDGGLTNVCNGVTGPQGLTGPALTASALPSMSAVCPTGGVLLGLPDGGSLPVCNGAQGVAGPTGLPGVAGPQGAMGSVGPAGPAGTQGLTGPTGLTGAAGSQGPTGNTGPAGAVGPQGQVLYLDGGVVLSPGGGPEFAGFTSMTYSGLLGGYPGAHAKCSAEFPGAFLCTVSDYDDANSPVAPGGTGAWIDYNRTTSGQRDHSSCANNAAWNWGTTGTTGRSLNAIGYPTTAYCNELKPLACCRQVSRIVFRGYTAATYNGLLGGYPGANAKCSAEFPGSFLCTTAEYDLGNSPVAPGAAGAWSDYNRTTTGQRDHSSCANNGAWNWGITGTTGRSMNALGYPTTANCSDVKPLACCSKR